MVPFAGFDMPVSTARSSTSTARCARAPALRRLAHGRAAPARAARARVRAAPVFTNDVAGTGRARPLRPALRRERRGRRRRHALPHGRARASALRERLERRRGPRLAAPGARRERARLRDRRRERRDRADRPAGTARRSRSRRSSRSRIRAAEALALRARRAGRASACCSRAPATRARTATRSSRRRTQRSRSGTRFARRAATALALAGLGARDTLRPRWRYPLYGHELDREHDPIEAGLERFVALRHATSAASRAARARAERPKRRSSSACVLEGRQVARAGLPDRLRCAGDGVGHERYLRAECRWRDRARLRSGRVRSGCAASRRDPRQERAVRDRLDAVLQARQASGSRAMADHDIRDPRRLSLHEIGRVGARRRRDSCGSASPTTRSPS